MLKLIGIILLLLVVGVVVYAAMQPDTFRVQRAASIKAPPEKIFPLITHLKGWTAWSPYETKDPGMKREYSGPDSGKGAVYAWEGNKEVGKGRMEILEATPSSKIVLKLDFFVPFEAHNIGEFTLEPQGESTLVTWSIHGPQPFLTKVMCIFFNMDKMIGTDFEAGLAKLKSLAEK
jgi:uncharacterized protein YndB with AHSA1/START domain